MKRFLVAIAACLSLFLCLMAFNPGTRNVSYATALAGQARSPVEQNGSLPSGMVGVTWDLVAFQRAPLNVENTTGEGITLKFEADGTLGGFGGCNGYGGNYDAGPGQTISIHSLVSTFIACDEPVLSTENAYFRALSSVTTYSYDGSHLQLNFDNGQGQLGYITSAQGGGTPGMPTTGGADGSIGVLVLLVIALACAFIGAGYLMVRHAKASEETGASDD